MGLLSLRRSAEWRHGDSVSKCGSKKATRVPNGITDQSQNWRATIGDLAFRQKYHIGKSRFAFSLHCARRRLNFQPRLASRYTISRIFASICNAAAAQSFSHRYGSSAIYGEQASVTVATICINSSNKSRRTLRTPPRIDTVASAPCSQRSARLGAWRRRQLYAHVLERSFFSATR